ncbi:MAG TPA: hypothetical protein VFL83_15550 [Anaeromyxobacter sp.]|nr:hypothetical protein [Anaeromyxobacter sp.]
MSGLSVVLAVALLGFLGVASGVLLWEGLSGVRHGHAAVRAHARARLVVGAVGFAAVLWLGIGLLSHAR